MATIRKNEIAFKISMYIIMAIVSFVILFPLFWIFTSSITPDTELFKSPIDYFPDNPTIASYQKLFRDCGLLEKIINTFIITIPAITINVIVCMMAAYGFGRHDSRGLSIAYALIVFSIMVPAVVKARPLFTFFRSVHMYDTFIGLIILYCSNLIPFSMVILGGFLKDIPVSMDEAATIDGATTFQKLIYVLIPLMRPAMFSLGMMSSLPLIDQGQSFSITRENPKGEKGKGGMATGVLGKSRKGAPAFRNIPQGETIVIADIDGPGIIQHIWFTISDTKDCGYFTLSDVVLRIYWDGEETPSVESPIGDFFLNGFSTYTKVSSLPITVNPVRGYNCYFSMPFRKHALITIENQHPGELKSFFYQIDFTRYPELPENMGYFHAQYRRQRLTELKKDYVIVDNIHGSGLYVGTFIALTALERYWYGEGEVKFYIDGDDEYPTICGTGMEDYFGGGFGFVEDQRKETPAVETLFQTPFQGYHYFSASEPNHSWRFEGACPPMRGFYRFHIPDPVRFRENLKVTIQQIGICDTGLFERQDDIASVAYWYQSEPHTAFSPLPDRLYRQPR